MKLMLPFAPPVFASPEQTLRARILHVVVGVTMLVAVGFLPLIAIMQPATATRVIEGPVGVNRNVAAKPAKHEIAVFGNSAK